MRTAVRRGTTRQRNRRLRFVWFLLALLPGPLHAAGALAPALAALEEGDLTAAIDQLTSPARNGDAAAAYDLAIAIDRQGGDPEQVRFWLRQAARHGLVQAYRRLNAQAVKPAPQARALVLVTPDDWIRHQNPRHYTLQLASSTNRRVIDRYYRENGLEGQGGYYRNRREGQDWYALVYGAYPTVGEAKAAIGNLPEALRKWSPWVRRLRDIQRIMQPLDASAATGG